VEFELYRWFPIAFVVVHPSIFSIKNPRFVGYFFIEIGVTALANMAPFYFHLLIDNNGAIRFRHCLFGYYGFGDLHGGIGLLLFQILFYQMQIGRSRLRAIVVKISSRRC
jgi:hypothetical protein